MRTRGRATLPLLALFLLLAPAFPQQLPEARPHDKASAADDAAPAAPEDDAPLDPKPESDERKNAQPAQTRVVLRTGPAPERLRAPGMDTPLVLSALLTDVRQRTPWAPSPRVEPGPIEAADLVSGLRSLPPPA
ncbi:MAG: hypothetical protein ACE10D_09480 [Planctomycetota bacterium]|nr:hypothetical protein [Planctomycetota bacterium]